jgi:hypothetical protein
MCLENKKLYIYRKQHFRCYMSSLYFYALQLD